MTKEELEIQKEYIEKGERSYGDFDAGSFSKLLGFSGGYVYNKKERMVILLEDHVRLIDRIFDIIEVIAISGTPLNLSEVAKAVDMSKTTVYRLLSSMCDRGYIEKNKDNTYTIGIKMFETVSCHINNLELQTESRPYLFHLKAELEEVLYQCKFEKFTKNTITNLADFKRYLKIVRKQGWAMDNEEYQLGHKCIGAPIYDYRGGAVAAISASGPTALLPEDKIEFVIRHVKDTAMQISRRMGYTG